MKYIRWIFAWASYLIGDWISELLNVLPQSDRWEWLSTGVCWLYNRAMVLSLAIQGEGDFGPWNAAAEDELRDLKRT